MTIDSWIVEAAKQSPDKTAILFRASDSRPATQDKPATQNKQAEAHQAEPQTVQHQEFSYAKLAKLIDDRTHLLKQLNVSHGDRIAWYGLNNPDVFVLLFACARIGAILVPLNWRLAHTEIQAIVDNCEPKIVFYDQHFSAEIESLNCAQSIYVDPKNGVSTDIDSSAIHDKDTNRITPSITDPVLLAYTSGSTGQPKGVVLTQAAIMSNSRMSIDAHQMTSQDNVLVLLPLFHVGGLNILATPALSIGATITLHEKFNPDDACADLTGATLSVVVPTVLKAMLNNALWDSIDLSSVRALSIGSTNVPERLIQQVHCRNIPMIQIYGATETAPLAIYQHINEAFDTVGSIGRIGCDCEIRLMSNNADVELGQPGEIWVKGNNVFSEYWQENELTQQSLQNGWFKTGDVARLDENGLFWFTDRIKHIIISGGENIYPAEIEQVLIQDKNIIEASVVGKADDKWGEIPVAVVASNETLTEKDIIDSLNGKLARYKHPKAVVFVDSLPRNAMGKVVVDDVKKIVG